VDLANNKTRFCSASSNHRSRLSNNRSRSLHKEGFKGCNRKILRCHSNHRSRLLNSNRSRSLNSNSSRSINSNRSSLLNSNCKTRLRRSRYSVFRPIQQGAKVRQSI
jgi:hypothetical protein